MSPAIQNFASSNLEQALLDHVSIAEPWALVERFAGLARISGSSDERAGAAYILTHWWYPTFPGLAIFFAVLGANFFGDALRDILDPRLRK